MTFGVFMHKDGSGYADIPEVHYQFPKAYLSRAKQMVGDWIIYREPVKIPRSKGFFAVAKVERIIPDPDRADHYRALIEEGSYLPFEPAVPHKIAGQPVERDLANAQASVRLLSNTDFARITALGLPDDDTLPRVGELSPRQTACRTRRCRSRSSGRSSSPWSIARSATGRSAARCCMPTTRAAQSPGGSSSTAGAERRPRRHISARSSEAGRIRCATASRCRARRTGCLIAG